MEEYLMKKHSLTYLMLLMIITILPASSATAAVNVGDTAPDFALVTTNGDTVRLSELAGKVVLLNFFHYY
jgi:peroxiredoxin